MIMLVCLLFHWSLSLSNFSKFSTGVSKQKIHKWNETFDFVYNDCGKSNVFHAINRQFAPYLYPFVIEYCILMVAMCCHLYENIGHCTQKLQSNERKYYHKLRYPGVPFLGVAQMLLPSLCMSWNWKCFRNALSQIVQNLTMIWCIDTEDKGLRL